MIALCATCAVETNGPPDADRVCPICADERQYLPKGGQRWTTVDELIARGHTLEWFEVEPDLVALTTKPGVGIGQQTMIARTPEGNLLWDPPGLITNEGVDHVRRLGRTLAIAASHPHMFGVQLAWAEVLNAPVLVNAKDADWLQRRGDAIELWSGERVITSTIILLEFGGHFPGSCAALWSAGAGGRGVLLAGDTIFANPDGTASFMRSYPNRIPLSGAVVQRLADATDRLEFDRLYNNFGGIIDQNAKAMVRFSADRHAAWVRGDYDHLT
ncbi:MAG TPA: hydrolase [Microlunatus sp.]|jgi:glyoxylase-like metal-dependent hydrolase (beta-lactamase superfamily II)|nr:hydrolase [Microlunatus sp.]